MITNSVPELKTNSDREGYEKDNIRRNNEGQDNKGQRNQECRILLRPF